MNLIDLISRAQQEKSSVNLESDILRDAVAEVISDQRKLAVQQCKGHLCSFELALKSQVTELKSIRTMEKAKAAKVKAMDRAFRYFAKTANPLPFFMAWNGTGQVPSNARYFCDEVGVPVPELDDPAWKVPDDFDATSVKGETEG